MMKISFKHLCVLFVSVLLFASCTKNYRLEFKPQAGDTYKQKITTEVIFEQSGSGMAVRTNNRNERMMTLKVESVENNRIVIKAVYDTIRAAVTMNDSVVHLSTLDTAAVATPQNVAPYLRAMINKPITITITRLGLIEEVEGLDKIGADMAKVPATDTMLTEQMVQVFSDKKMFISMLEQAMAYFPDHEVKVGDSWNINRDDVEIGELNGGMNVRLKEVVNGVATLECTGTLSSDRDTDISGRQGGTMKLDVATGRVRAISIVKEVAVREANLTIKMSATTE